MGVFREGIRTMYYTELYFKMQIYALIVLLSIGAFIILALCVTKWYIRITDRMREQTLERYEGKETKR